ncbi:aspartyl/glutamyl-tRNA amidotransferase subunit C [Candidatus Dependentiae bacterium]|nr:aspartyl/glutamyl-tRNA amidotransferase subunit C [Candidatus Dependentiae bacterium]
MVHMSREDLLKLGRSSSLHLTEDEIPLLMNNLQTVLSYAAALKDMAETYAGLAMPKNSNVMRDDKAIPTPAEPLLAEAPQREDNYFVVPVILKQ